MGRGQECDVVPSRKRRGLPWPKHSVADAPEDGELAEDIILDSADDRETVDGDTAGGGATDGDTVDGETADGEAAESDAADGEGAPKSPRRGRSLPRIRVSLTALVAVLLVVLVGAGSWLFLTRPVAQSPIELTAFDEILSAARSGIVDVTSFDYLTLDQDIAEIDAVTTDELHDDTITALTDRRDQLVTDQQVSATEVIAASVTQATATRATALIVLRARVKNLLTPQETVTRYRIEVKLRLVDGRWLLSGLTGA
ncbi:MAG: hypothetical protein H0T54_01500 [Geodermatophilaceae bacterium]|nr:hypothetical protein [Geodermatophilaceae bacterium]